VNCSYFTEKKEYSMIFFVFVSQYTDVLLRSMDRFLVLSNLNNSMRKERKRKDEKYRRGRGREREREGELHQKMK